MLSNTPENIEAHFGVPMCGAVWHALNYRTDMRNLRFMLTHAETKVFLVDTEFSAQIAEELAAMPATARPLVIDVDDPLCAERGSTIGSLTYEQFLAEGDPNAPWSPPEDEWDTMALCYTSGTTADPKGVLLHHRGAYLNGMNNIVKWPLPRHAVYLWTLPMFHCNGWYFHYSVTEVAGTHVCLRKVVAQDIFNAFAEHQVTHLCGAPIVMSTMLQYQGTKNWSQKVHMQVGGGAPPAPTLKRMAEFGIDVCHVYGLTEVYGPATQCLWKEEWNQLPVEEQATIKARQGVRCSAMEYLDVVDQETRKPVPRDGETIGEVVMAGNITMKGYLKNPAATEKEFRNGVFNTGDLAVMHPDGYIQLKDRSKDIILSEGENISTLEVESLLLKHPNVLEVAVVARADEKWGEAPAAWIVWTEAAKASKQTGRPMSDEEMNQSLEEELYHWCRENMPRLKVPQTFVFEGLDKVKTSTGKIQKHVLRGLAKNLKKPPRTMESADDARKSKWARLA